VSTDQERLPRAVAWAAALPPLLLGAVVALLAWDLSLGELGQPGPGLWPFVLGAALCVSAVVLVLTRGHGVGCERVTWAGLRRPLVGTVAAVAFVVVFSQLGAVAAGLLVLTAWLRFLAGRTWRFSLAVAAGCTAAAYLIFVVGLNVSLPSAF
jgi:putative tricarboxylic transport membrane protein